MANRLGIRQKSLEDFTHFLLDCVVRTPARFSTSAEVHGDAERATVAVSPRTQEIDTVSIHFIFHRTTGTLDFKR